MIKLTAHANDGRNETVILRKSEVNHVHVEFIPTFSDDDIQKITLSGSGATENDVEVHFERRCTPENPFYVRWINDDGGYNYQMFENRFAIERKSEKPETFEPFIPDTESARATTATIDVAAETIVHVGVEQATRGQFEMLAKLPLSPKIEFYNPDLHMWQRINMSGDQSNTWRADTPAGFVEFKFILPKRNVQF